MLMNGFVVLRRKLMSESVIHQRAVVPAQAGTHTPQRLGSITKAGLIFKH